MQVSGLSTPFQPRGAQFIEVEVQKINCNSSRLNANLGSNVVGTRSSDNSFNVVIRDELRAAKNDRVLQERLMEAKSLNRKNETGAVMHKFSLWDTGTDNHTKKNLKLQENDNDGSGSGISQTEGESNLSRKVTALEAVTDISLAQPKQASKLRGPLAARGMHLKLTGEPDLEIKRTNMPNEVKEDEEEEQYYAEDEDHLHADFEDDSSGVAVLDKRMLMETNASDIDGDSTLGKNQVEGQRHARLASHLRSMVGQAKGLGTLSHSASVDTFQELLSINDDVSTGLQGVVNSDVTAKVIGSNLRVGKESQLQRLTEDENKNYDVVPKQSNSQYPTKTPDLSLRDHHHNIGSMRYEGGVTFEHLLASFSSEDQHYEGSFSSKNVSVPEKWGDSLSPEDYYTEFVGIDSDLDSVEEEEEMKMKLKLKNSEGLDSCGSSSSASISSSRAVNRSANRNNREDYLAERSSRFVVTAPASVHPYNLFLTDTVEAFKVCAVDVKVMHDNKHPQSNLESSLDAGLSDRVDTFPSPSITSEAMVLVDSPKPSESKFVSKVTASRQCKSEPRVGQRGQGQVLLKSQINRVSSCSTPLAAFTPPPIKNTKDQKPPHSASAALPGRSRISQSASESAFKKSTTDQKGNSLLSSPKAVRSLPFERRQIAQFPSSPLYRCSNTAPQPQEKAHSKTINTGQKRIVPPKKARAVSDLGLADEKTVPISPQSVSMMSSSQGMVKRLTEFDGIKPIRLFSKTLPLPRQSDSGKQGSRIEHNAKESNLILKKRQAGNLVEGEGLNHPAVLQTAHNLARQSPLSGSGGFDGSSSLLSTATDLDLTQMSSLALRCLPVKIDSTQQRKVAYTSASNGDEDKLKSEQAINKGYSSAILSSAALHGRGNRSVPLEKGVPSERKSRATSTDRSREKVDTQRERSVSPSLSELSQEEYQSDGESETATSELFPLKLKYETNGERTLEKKVSTTVEIDADVYMAESAGPSPLRWRRGQIIGEGTFGRVYKGMNEKTGELLAVKQLSLAEGTKAEVLLLRKEIQVMWDLNHKNIVRYLGTAQSSKYLFIILEYVPGGSIHSMLTQFGAFSESLTWRFVSQILSGVDYLHQKGIIHRDIKGANVLVTDVGVAKLADFGCSKQLPGLCTASLEESLRVIRGSVPWMAPEMIKQSGHGRSSDIWSVGATFIEMATGKPPWPEFTNNLAALFHVATSLEPPPVPPNLSTSCSIFLSRCMAINANERATASELIRDHFMPS